MRRIRRREKKDKEKEDEKKKEEKGEEKKKEKKEENKGEDKEKDEKDDVDKEKNWWANIVDIAGAVEEKKEEEGVELLPVEEKIGGALPRLPQTTKSQKVIPIK